LPNAGSTAGEALVAGIAMLRPHSSSARSDALLFLSRALDRDGAFVLAHGDERIDPNAERRFLDDCRRRATGVPVAYVLGTAGFFGRTFRVDERVLVPRPESESLIVAAVAYARMLDAAPMRLLDIGTGSGALACTLAAELPRARVDATDRSDAALAVALENARWLGVGERCRFYAGNLADAVLGTRYHVVIANLPYVASADIPSAPSPLAFEPILALDGGADGLRVYADLTPSLPELLAPGGLALLEAAPFQMSALRTLAAAGFPGAAVSVGCDLGGSERFVAVRAPGR
jgi:release factor glutamine methyltransferase